VYASPRKGSFNTAHITTLKNKSSSNTYSRKEDTEVPIEDKMEVLINVM